MENEELNKIIDLLLDCAVCSMFVRQGFVCSKISYYTVVSVLTFAGIGNSFVNKHVQHSSVIAWCERTFVLMHAYNTNRKFYLERPIH